jgi:hypothetical protein
LLSSPQIVDVMYCPDEAVPDNRLDGDDVGTFI